MLGISSRLLPLKTTEVAANFMTWPATLPGNICHIFRFMFHQLNVICPCNNTCCFKLKLMVLINLLIISEYKMPIWDNIKARPLKLRKELGSRGVDFPTFETFNFGDFSSLSTQQKLRRLLDLARDELRQLKHSDANNHAKAVISGLCSLNLYDYDVSFNNYRHF